MRKRGTGKKEILCATCNKSFVVSLCYLPRRKFCSKQCRDSAHKVFMEGKDMGGATFVSCAICNKVFRSYKSLKSQTCSNECRYKNHSKKSSGELHINWKGGKNGYRGKGWKWIRLSVLMRDSNKCLLCGTEKRLHVHHKIPYRITQDNSLENLMTLCLPCHMKEERKISLV